jgi:hypothetical protein
VNPHDVLHVIGEPVANIQTSIAFVIEGMDSNRTLWKQSLKSFWKILQELPMHLNVPEHCLSDA